MASVFRPSISQLPQVDQQSSIGNALTASAATSTLAACCTAQSIRKCPNTDDRGGCFRRAVADRPSSNVGFGAVSDGPNRAPLTTRPMVSVLGQLCSSMRLLQC